MACISPKAYELVINDLQKIDIPYGFKIKMHLKKYQKVILLPLKINGEMQVIQIQF